MTMILKQKWQHKIRIRKVSQSTDPSLNHHCVNFVKHSLTLNGAGRYSMDCIGESASGMFRCGIGNVEGEGVVCSLGGANKSKRFIMEKGPSSSKLQNGELCCNSTRLTHFDKIDEHATETFTKEFKARPLFCSSTLSSLMPISVLPCSFFRFLCLITVFIFITSNSIQTTEATFFDQSRCETFGWNAYPVWKYRAKARYVPPLQMNRKMQKELLKLFRGDDDSSSSEEDYGYDNLDTPEIHHIAEMCPRDAFFYSLSPKHIEATVALARMFAAQPSPPAVLHLAKALLRSRRINPKVWYFGLIGAAQERPDMTGFKLAHPVDAMPDLFIPGPLLFDVMDRYRSALERSDNTTASAPSKLVTIKKQRGKRSPNRIKTLMQTMSKKIVETLGKIEIGNSSSVISSINNTISGSNTSNKDESESRGFGNKSSAKKVKNDRVFKRKTKKSSISKQQRRDDVFEGNTTKYRADTKMWKKARIEALEDCIVVDGSVGVRNGKDNKLWYFREDMMVSQHHWYWHQEYPLNSTRQRPRRAELFFFMHRNLIARYNAERLSNGMPIVRPFDIRPGAEIRTAYDSQLADVNSGKYWTPRPPGVHITDILHEDDPDFERNLILDEYNDLYWRLVRSVDVGHLLLTPLKTLPIRHTKGIEPLGNTVEASELNVNPAFYNAMGFHNLGHQLIGLSTDPKFKRRLPTGVMADTATTMRDPEFYSYHTLVDNLFDKYKKSLPPYKPRGGEYPLRWDGVEILDVQVMSKNGGPKNQLRTFWSRRRFELAPGVDQSIHNGDLDVDVCAVHLNHEPFDFKITVTLDPCAKTKSNKGTMRLFMAPRYDEHGHRLSLKAQRRLMIHLDAFPVDLRVGQNVIYRRSYDSSAVKPWSRSLREYENAPKLPPVADFCGCGWPTHLYIPKGTHEGMAFDVFAMITNFDHDYVEDDPETLKIPEPCNSPYLYCGIPWRKYPDAKPMGYPFDRLPFSAPIKCPKGTSLFPLVLCKILQWFWYIPVETLDEYVTYAPNMASTVVEIKHFDHLAW